jgi:hypothetical protein
VRGGGGVGACTTHEPVVVTSNLSAVMADYQITPSGFLVVFEKPN